MAFESVSKNIDALVPLRTLLNHARRKNLVPAVAFAGICLLVCISQLARGMPPSSAGQPASATTLSLAETQRIIAKATLHGVPWTGPESGPPAQPGKSIAFISEDLRNGGILGVAQGVREAVRTMGWTLKIFDAGGTSAGRLTAFERAMASKPDGLILCGADAQNSKPELARIASRGIPIVAWHAGSTPGPIAGTAVAMNVTTDPVEVARVTALGAVAQSNGHAGVVILTDSRFEIAVTKSNVMADIIRACKGCTLLEVRDVAISESAEKMPAITKALLARYGKRWTDALAINDIYFDYATPALTKAGVPSSGLSLLSAGDGSATAFLRVQAKTYQTGTVAEPLNQQGWQLVDELNRLFAGQPVSGFVAPVHLVNADNIAFDGGERFQYDPKNGYRDIYRRIWKR
ncbi:ribose transport system substrate-binding protein [Caballeronia udeis]|uniref:Ribose transport system substrate-binding protein n=2 Tax=Caballeronia udeis TaxID=1232866 RepID=A0ABW8MYU0_9BURK